MYDIISQRCICVLRHMQEQFAFLNTKEKYAGWGVARKIKGKLTYNF